MGRNSNLKKGDNRTNHKRNVPAIVANDFDSLVADAIELEEQGDRYASDYVRSMRLYTQATERYQQALSPSARQEITSTLQEGYQSALYNLGRLLYIRVSKLPETDELCAERWQRIEEAIKVMEESLTLPVVHAIAQLQLDDVEEDTQVQLRMASLSILLSEMSESMSTITDALFNYAQALTVRGEVAEYMDKSEIAEQNYRIAGHVFTVVRQLQEAELRSLRNDQPTNILVPEDTVVNRMDDDNTMQQTTYVTVLEESITTPESIIDTLLAHANVHICLLNLSLCPFPPPITLITKISRLIDQAQNIVKLLPIPPPSTAKVLLLSASPATSEPTTQIMLVQAHFASSYADKLCETVPMTNNDHIQEVIQLYSQAISILEEIVIKTNHRHLEALCDMADVGVTLADLYIRTSSTVRSYLSEDQQSALQGRKDIMNALIAALQNTAKHDKAFLEDPMFGQAWRALAMSAKGYNSALLVEPNNLQILLKMSENEMRRSRFGVVCSTLCTSDTMQALQRNAKILAERCWNALVKQEELNRQHQPVRTPFELIGINFAREIMQHLLDISQDTNNAQQMGSIRQQAKYLGIV